MIALALDSSASSLPGRARASTTIVHADGWRIVGENMIDFSELPQDGVAFEQLVREILLILDLHPRWSGIGPDRGRDILATEILSGPLAQSKRLWLVQCKHFAHAGRSVGRNDVGAVVDDCHQA